MFQGLRTALYPAPDFARAKAWYMQALGTAPYFDEPFYVGFSVGGFELGLVPDVPVSRPPAGEWVLMASRVHASAAGIGFCETVLSDDAGLFGRVLQSLVETPPTLGLPGHPIG